MARKYPIGLQSFREIREGGFVYVDKTEKIHQMVDYGKYYFLSRPRRFGKSLLLDTIAELFSGSEELLKDYGFTINGIGKLKIQSLEFHFQI